MKQLRKTLAVLLAVLMTASALSVPIFAGNSEDDPYACLKEGTGYVAIGDSFTRGYGSGENWEEEIYLNDTYGNFNCRNVEGSYPTIVSKEFGLNIPNDIRDTTAQYWPLCHDAVSVAYILDLLGIDDGFRDDEFTYNDGPMLRRYETDLKYYGDPESYNIEGTGKNGTTGEIMSVRDMLKNASLISIGLGQTDVIYKAQLYGLNVLDLSDYASLPAGIANIGKLLNQYFNYYKKAYPMLLDYIKEINPDAKVVLVSTMNPIEHATATDDFAIQIGCLINGIMDTMNSFIKDCALRYGYMYVDITEVETPSSATTMSLEHIFGITDSTEYALIAHPTTKGYTQIAQKVITAVKNELQKDSINSVQTFFAYIFNRLKQIFVDFFSRFNIFSK